MLVRVYLEQFRLASDPLAGFINLTSLLLPALSYWSVSQVAGLIYLNSIPAICSELLSHWKSVLDYITKTAPTQVMQGVRHKVVIHISTNT